MVITPLLAKQPSIALLYAQHYGAHERWNINMLISTVGSQTTAVNFQPRSLTVEQDDCGQSGPNVAVNSDRFFFPTRNSLNPLSPLKPVRKTPALPPLLQFDQQINAMHHCSYSVRQLPAVNLRVKAGTFESPPGPSMYVTLSE